MWKLIDKQGDWIRSKLTPNMQMRIGVISLWIGVAAQVWIPFSGEPIAIGTLSALALVFGAFSIIAAIRAEEEAATPSKCPRCGWRSDD